LHSKGFPRWCRNTLSLLLMLMLLLLLRLL
jgi:hypothetical protein